jgi:2-keto-3-deoxy-L-rhamnonate aldolase RhmA
VTVMLESALAFEHLDEIVSTDGIDAVTLGPSDLAQELGVFGTPDAGPVIDAHRDRLIDAARRHGKDVAMLCSTAVEARRWIDAGVKIIAVGSDVSVIQQAFAGIVADIRR